MCFGLNLFRLSVCLAALPHNLYSFQFLDAYPSKLRKSLLNDKKWFNILAIIHIFEHLVCFCVFIQTVQGINIVYLCLKHLQMCFLFNMAAASEQSFSRCCVMKQSVVAWGPIKSRFHSCIRWHTYEDFFFSPHLGHMMNLEWLSNCRRCKDSDTLRRTWFADNQVKTGMGGFFLWTLCLSVERHNVVGCPAAWQERKRGERESNWQFL